MLLYAEGCLSLEKSVDHVRKNISENIKINGGFGVSIFFVVVYFYTSLFSVETAC